ncbi:MULTISPECIES: GNAT family N-acetyltransferase [Comamonadaceae]|uniref:GNAT family N-acetyltransferase n=1 Tax=Comamonadaceae TaxID=80864 RepID=UPI00272458C8|nr:MULTISPECIES: GNAT family protein [Comamonadaceae]MDO9145885.1 GNAT family protein [Rhodoferax sp.]MDP3887626.1 GNAT family protein [Hydrogenophaga sp.]
MSIEIKLRSLELADIDSDYCRWYENDDGHLNFFTGSGRIFSHDVLVKDFEEGLKTGKWFYYLIESDSGEKIGNVKIGPIDIKNKTSDLVCLLGNRNYLGKGIATKAIAIANLIAFQTHDIRRLHGGMYASNISSIKAYTRANWFIEGTFKGFYWMNGVAEDRVCVACLNPNYFSTESSIQA